jgi:hypoxanthine-DNA glycosylase
MLTASPATPYAALQPLLSPSTRLLILGSFPGAASLKAQQYYAHPQNHFWRILQAIWPCSPMDTGGHSYQKRSGWLLSKRLGLWDVYAACEREGSLDSNIRNAVLNDFSAVSGLCPELQAIAFNGAESFRHAKYCDMAGLSVCKLPSTSAANASWSFERKLAAWREVFEQHGLI